MKTAIAGKEDDIEADNRFHATIAQASRNPYFDRFLTFLGANLHGAIAKARSNTAVRHPESILAVQAEHEAVFAAIEQRDAPGCGSGDAPSSVGGDGAAWARTIHRCAVMSAKPLEPPACQGPNPVVSPPALRRSGRCLRHPCPCDRAGRSLSHGRQPQLHAAAGARSRLSRHARQPWHGARRAGPDQRLRHRQPLHGREPEGASGPAARRRGGRARCRRRRTRSAARGRRARHPHQRTVRRRRGDRRDGAAGRPRRAARLAYPVADRRAQPARTRSAHR